MSNNLYGSLDIDSRNIFTEGEATTAEQYHVRELIVSLRCSFDIHEEKATQENGRADVLVVPKEGFLLKENYNWGAMVFEVKRGHERITNKIAEQLKKYKDSAFTIKESGMKVIPNAVILYPCRHELGLGDGFGHAFHDGPTLKVLINGRLVLETKDRLGNMRLVEPMKSLPLPKKPEPEAKKLEPEVKKLEPEVKKPETEESEWVSIIELGKTLARSETNLKESLLELGFEVRKVRDNKEQKCLQSVLRYSATEAIKDGRLKRGSATVKSVAETGFVDPISEEEVAKAEGLKPKGAYGRVGDQRKRGHVIDVRYVDQGTGGMRYYSRSQLEHAGVLRTGKTVAESQPINQTMPVRVKNKKTLSSEPRSSLTSVDALEERMSKIESLVALYGASLDNRLSVLERAIRK